MQAELRELTDGRLLWSLGSVFAITRWRVGEDWQFLLALAIIAPWSGSIAFLPLLLVPPRMASAQPDLIHLWFLAGPSLLCVVLAAVRPVYWRLIGIGVPLASGLQGYFSLQSMVQQQGGRMDHFVIMDAPPPVGLAAAVGVGFLGAWVGQLIIHEVGLLRRSSH